ncbi:NAD-dependent epimerase/dehydratase family protein [Paucilactobacillus nenjiangensis]|uniref:NAD-dependent epimerase/dehydratase family protein n=1 Tax=Paucilactobacillus nenjiangensis TaxID=1296540 RepID=UPI0010F4D8D5|nr:NAD-dependent epimerase/dehydratase family protein [Paucilactobacillus nenjiangensis]
MTKVLVTGGAGFIGYHLSKRLLEQKFEVVGIDNLTPYYDPQLKKDRVKQLKDSHFQTSYTFINEDIANKEQIFKIFSEEQPDLVVNLAAQAGVRYSIDHPDDYIHSNLIGFYNILEACRNFPVKHLVFASSSSVYGNRKNAPFSTQDNVDHPISLYAATKKSNELMAYTYSHLYDIPATGLRFFTVYGPFGRPDMAYFKFANRIIKGETIDIYNGGDMLRDFTYVDDIVTGIVEIMNKVPERKNDAQYNVYNIGNSSPEKLGTMIELLEQFLGKKAQKNYMGMQPGDVYQTYADITELKRDFNFAPSTSLKTGLKKFVEWYKNYYNI